MTPFEFEFTPEHLAACLPGNPNASTWYDALCAVLPQYDISSVARVASFLAQTGHESNNYTQLHENLNYRSESLIKTWPKRFNAENAPTYAHNQEMIANKVYASRMGNGDEASGDGWKFRGRGILQITGHDNYAACSQFVWGDDTLIQTPELLETDMESTIKAACWFWSVHHCNVDADNSNIEAQTQKINGGQIGIDDRIARYNHALDVMQGV